MAKYLFIAAYGDDPGLTTKDLGFYFKHFLERVDWTRDLHFQTKTTIDTLDYSGDDWNGGSKVVIACRGEAIRKLKTENPKILHQNIQDSQVILPGILGITIKPFESYSSAEIEMSDLIQTLKTCDLSGFPLIVVSDDSQFCAENMNNFVWVTFTRSNPSHDIYGVDSFVAHKHWGCKGSLIIDAPKKPHHAPELVPDENIRESVASWLKF